MEIGSFIEMQFPKGYEWYRQENNIARLNSGRSAIWHAFRVSGCEAIWIPYYQCDTVRDCLRKNCVKTKFYHIDKDFNPIDCFPQGNEAVLIVNYYGVMSVERMRELAKKYCHPIIDNSQAFFSKPLDESLNVYSCRKFMGVSDGAYVIGEKAERYTDEYVQSYSSDTALFLLLRIEYGCEGKAYQNRMINEHRINTDRCMLMSKLTRTILDGTDYDLIIKKRKENFAFAHSLFKKLNMIEAKKYYDQDTVPMVYPLVMEDDSLLKRLKESKHFQGHWWSYICKELPENTYEYWLSRYMIPIAIDQRYGEKELLYIYEVVCATK